MQSLDHDFCRRFFHHKIPDTPEVNNYRATAVRKLFFVPGSEPVTLRCQDDANKTSALKLTVRP